MSDTIFCTKCGLEQPIIDDYGTSSLKRCDRCGRIPVDQVTLLVALSRSSATVRMCPNPTCGAPNRFDPFCFACGARCDDELNLSGGPGGI